MASPDDPPSPPGRSHRAARLAIPGTVACDQCSGSMHRGGRMFMCDRCGRSLTVATVSKLQPGSDLTEG